MSDGLPLGMIMDSFGEFDRVRIVGRDHIQWLSTDRDVLDGVWVVTAIVNHELIVSRATMLIRIPATDVRLEAAYSISAMLEYMGRSTGYGKKHGSEDEGQGGTSVDAATGK